MQLAVANNFLLEQFYEIQFFFFILHRLIELRKNYH